MSISKMVPLPFPEANPPTGEARKIIGSYKLIKTTFPPEARKMRGENPFGMIVYDSNGYMAVQIAPGREYEASTQFPLTSQQAEDAILGLVCYFGTYEVNWEEKTVSHHRVFMMPPLLLDKPFIRKFKFLDDDTIELRPLESENVLIWERLS